MRRCGYTFYDIGIVVALAALVAFAVFVNSDAYGVRRSRGADRDSYYLGQSYVLAEKPEQAKEAFRQATEADPEDADAYYLLGQMEMNTGEVQAAGEHLKQALEIACPHVLLPFAREAVNDLVCKGGFPQLLINPINFEALYAQKQAAIKQPVAGQA